MFYSKSTKGFYDPAINQSMPADVVDISEELYQQLIQGQAQGYVIEHEADGSPYLAARMPSIQEIREGMVVQAWAFRRALTQSGLRSDVETAVAGASQDVKDMWQFSTIIRRLYPMVVSVGQAINKTPEEIDEVFQLAISIEASES